MEPGCKVDTVLVLEGEQGIKKSTAIAALFGEEYTAESVSLFDQHNKMVMAMMGAWVVELAEFVAIARSHHASVKGLISMRRDRVVLPYARLASPATRGAASSSARSTRKRPATSPTAPATAAIGRDGHEIDLDGHLASPRPAMGRGGRRYRAGERWWLEPDEERDASSEQSEREEEDAWVEPLGDSSARWSPS
jgi:predicted P-loop ATPase